MFIWFVVPRQRRATRGRAGSYGAERRAEAGYDAFGAVARLIDGTTSTVEGGRAPRVKMYVPYLALLLAAGDADRHDVPRLRRRRGRSRVGQPTATLGADQSITFVRRTSTPVKGHTYTVVADAQRAERPQASRAPRRSW